MGVDRNTVCLVLNKARHMAFYMQLVRIRQVCYRKTGELNRQESARTVRAGGKRYIGLLNQQWDS